MIKTINSKIVYQNRWLTVREDQVLFGGTVPGIYSTIEKPDCVIILPFDGMYLYLVKQFRYAPQKDFIEFPCGSHEEKNLSDEVQLVKDELKEETGLISSKITKLGIIHEVPATLKQNCHVFLAENLTQGEQELEATETDLTVVKLTLAEFEDAVAASEITDAKTLSSYMLWQVKKRAEKK